MRIVALLGGGDWADASIDHLVVPKNMNLETVKKEWDRWYREVYVPDPNPKKIYKSLAQFMKERGAREATDREVEPFWGGP